MGLIPSKFLGDCSEFIFISSANGDREGRVLECQVSDNASPGVSGGSVDDDVDGALGMALGSVGWCGFGHGQGEDEARYYTKRVRFSVW